MLRAFLFVLVLQNSLWAQETTCAITLVPHNSAFQHWWYDNHTREGFVAGLDMRFKAPFRGSMDFAACLASNPGEKWLVRAVDADGSGCLKDLERITQGGEFGGGIYFDRNQVSEMDSLGEGTFLFAILVDGKRRSNVIRVTIDHAYDAKAEPPLRVFAVQPQEGTNIQQLGVWLVPPVKNDKLTNQAASTIDLSLDGKWHTARPGMWTGMVYPLPRGEADAENCLFFSYTPPITPFAHAKVQARLMDYTSAVTDLSFDPKDSKQFDHAFGLN